MKTIERTLFTSYCLWLIHDLLHVSFLVDYSYPIKLFLFSNYPMRFNVLRHVMKFRNYAVLRLRILPLFRLDYFCKNRHSCSALCFKMSFLYALQKLKKKKAAPWRVIELNEESEKVAVQVDIFFKLKIFILFHNLLLLTLTYFIYFSIDDCFILIY